MFAILCDIKVYLFSFLAFVRLVPKVTFTLSNGIHIELTYRHHPYGWTENVLVDVFVSVLSIQKFNSFGYIQNGFSWNGETICIGTKRNPFIKYDFPLSGRHGWLKEINSIKKIQIYRNQFRTFSFSSSFDSHHTRWNVQMVNIYKMHELANT